MEVHVPCLQQFVSKDGTHLFLFLLYKSWGDVSKLFFKHIMAHTGSYKMAHFQNKANVIYNFKTKHHPTRKPITSTSTHGRRYFAQGARAKGRGATWDEKKDWRMNAPNERMWAMFKAFRRPPGVFIFKQNE